MLTPRTIPLLVVEDDHAYLYLIRKAFSVPTEKTRWELTVATDGQEALDILFAEENEHVPLPDLILLDWKLPKVSGEEVLRRVKRHEKLRKMPVLVFSSSEADKDIHEAYSGHANGYITKPADIARCLRSSKRLNSSGLPSRKSRRWCVSATQVIVLGAARSIPEDIRS